MEKKTLTIRIPMELYIAYQREMLDRQEQGKPVVTMTQAALNGLQAEVKRGKS